MQLSITIPDAFAEEIINEFCAASGYAETITDNQGNPIPNPVTKLQHTRAQVKAFLIDPAKRKRIQTAAATAGQTADGQLN